MWLHNKQQIRTEYLYTTSFDERLFILLWHLYVKLLNTNLCLEDQEVIITSGRKKLFLKKKVYNENVWLINSKTRMTTSQIKRLINVANSHICWYENWKVYWIKKKNVTGFNICISVVQSRGRNFSIIHVI